MHDQIDALLAFSRLGRQQIETTLIQLDDLVQSVADELRTQAGGRNIKIIVEELGLVHVDPGMYRQALVSLLGNAIKFTRKQPIATIEIGRTVPEAGGPIVYYIKDNGAGFDMRYADNLFGMFRRLHGSDEFEGNGAGLSIAKSIIERHGGHIHVESTPGNGATFFFTLQSGSTARNPAGSDNSEKDAFPA